MKDKKEEKKPKKEKEKFDLGEILEKKRKKKRTIFGIGCFIITIIFMGLLTLNYFYGNKAYIRADIKVSSSSKLYSNSEPEDSRDLGEGALFIIYVNGIKRSDFLEQYEVLEISINEQQVNLEQVTYKHLHNALSIRMHSENYNLEEGNVVVISVKEKSSGQILTKRLYHKTEVV